MSDRAAEIVRRYQAGDHVADIVHDAGIGFEKFYAILDEEGVARRVRRRSKESPPGDLPPMVGRVCLILKAVGMAEAGMTQKEIRAACGLTLDVAKRFVAGLVWLDLLRRWPDRRYTLGPAVADLARDLLLQLDDRLQAGASREELAGTLGRPVEWVDVFLDGGL